MLIKHVNKPKTFAWIAIKLVVIIGVCEFPPEGMSTLAMGTVIFFSWERMSPNGSRTAPLKLNPKMASTTKL